MMCTMRAKCPAHLILLHLITSISYFEKGRKLQESENEFRRVPGPRKHNVNGQFRILYNGELGDF